MPPRARVTREMILDAAFALVRAEGQEALNVRAVARHLGCSTQPVLYAFAAMDELRAAVYERADAFHTAYILPRDAAGEEALLRLGLNYVRFGHEEGRLFRFLFESNQFEGMDLSGLLRGPGMNELVGVLAQGLGCGTEEAQKVFLTFFAVAHGLASLLCHNAMAYDEAECQTMLETVFYGALASMKGDTNAQPL
ncbi:MAG: TetR/AcrR family transcriptional regulator [Clostridia bacterium]|nr:TetR/AcrR family transcriptional regulator [Clostridia bacterium]MBR0205346.1 TetR/AcrR family transcriptional regulator [Clostridia bacterium]